MPVHRHAPSLGRPGLAAIRLTAGGDGVAYVGRLLLHALEEYAGRGGVTVLEVAEAAFAGGAARGRFLLRLTRAQAARRASWWLFNHLGPARAQLLVPPGVRQPYAVFLHGIEAWDPALSRQRTAVLRRASLLLANSAYTARVVQETHPAVGKVHPCPLGLLPASAVDEPDAQLLARVGTASVLIVGRMSVAERYKGHDQLIECWPGVLDAVPEAQLVIAGWGDDVDRLRAKARATRASERIVFAGFVSDATLQALLRRVAAFALPSRGEGFGLGYLEAMRAGLPCLGSTADAAGDVIVHGQTGLLVDPHDREALATAIVSLLRDLEGRTAMGEAGRRRFEREFTCERFRDRLLPLLRSAFGQTVETAS